MDMSRGAQAEDSNGTSSSGATAQVGQANVLKLFERGDDGADLVGSMNVPGEIWREKQVDSTKTCRTHGGKA